MLDDKPATTDDDIIKEAIEFRQMSMEANSLNAMMQKEDLNFLIGGEHAWSAADVAQRKSARRPIITINKLPTIIRQVTNDNLQNTPSIKVHPVDDDADIETAKVIGGLIRNIEYSSNGDVAYDTALCYAARAGVGYWRLIVDYCDNKSFDQEIRFQRLSNIFAVHFDYASEEIDGSDQTRCLLESRVSKLALKQMGAKKEYANFSCGEWVTDKYAIIGEYYRIEETADELLLLSNGRTILKSELKKMPVNVEVLKTRPTQRKKVMLYKMTAQEILERTEIKCDWIPVFPSYGNELNIDGKVTRSGITRDAKSPAALYNYSVTSAAEEIKSRNNTPYIGAVGQFKGFEGKWQTANVSNYPYLEYNPVTVNDTLAPPPQRQQTAEFPAGLMGMAMHFSDDIKATTGLFDSSLGAQGNATSGRQELAQQRQGDLSNYHYKSNFEKSQRQCGRCLVSMLPHYYDSERIVRVMGSDGKVESVRINAPKEGAAETILNNLTVGKYDVTISSGPNYQTQRQESSESMLAMAEKYPPLMEMAGDLVIKSLDWPNNEEISERVKKAMPPELTGVDDEEEQQLPPQVLQSMQQDHEQMQLMGQQIQMLTQELAAAKAGNDAKIEVAKINADSKLDVQELSVYGDLLKAQMQPPPDLQSAVSEDLSEPDES